MGGIALTLFTACGDDPSADPNADSTGVDTLAPSGSDGASSSAADGDGTTASGPGATSGSGQASADDTQDGEGDGAVPSPPIQFDLGALPDAPHGSQMGCAGIDFLFVVDNSGSMTAQQQQLLASFTGFINAIQDTIDDVTSYHVGVITSDAYSGNALGCQSIGDLVSQTMAGSFCQAANMDCTPFAEGYRFATEQDDLTTKFPCIAQVGTCGSPIEQPVTATIAALDPAKSAPGGCNEGFLREDAILVVVIVTDDPPMSFDMDDAHPDTDTSGWYDAVIAAKGGDPEAVVVIGFVPWMNVSCNGGLESPNLIEFVQAFGEQGVLASICEPDFGPVFAQTIETIETTCDSFVPSG